MSSSARSFSGAARTAARLSALRPLSRSRRSCSSIPLHPHPPTLALAPGASALLEHIRCVSHGRFDDAGLAAMPTRPCPCAPRAA
eukprot:4413548-Prymnesium_polylepis.1